MQTNVFHVNNLRLSQVTSFRAVLNSNECRHDNKYINFHTMQLLLTLTNTRISWYYPTDNQNCLRLKEYGNSQYTL